MGQVQVPGQLLCNRAPAFLNCAVICICSQGSANRSQIESFMLIKPLIFRSNHQLLQKFGNIFSSKRNAVIGSKDFRNHTAILISHQAGLWK
ncbi:Uncharacterised protein [Mycobacteroides abscessus subsp. abscessus]|nr:Uncharacterised protein [Mycobacteroides abscessus subsp. abscessus]